MSARLLKGDTVVVISGKDKGKTGKVQRVLAEDGKVIVEGINVVKRHVKPTQRNQQGGIVTKEAAIFASKVMLVDPKTGKPTRVRAKLDDKGKPTGVRVAVKSGEEIPAPARAAKA